MLKTVPPLTREAWLLFAVEEIKPIFSEKGYFLPAVRVSCAFPRGSGRSAVVGQCWGTSCSTDGVNEIFITPKYDKAIDILDTLTHELVHAVDNCEHKHGPEFKKIALSIGLEGKMIHASAGPNLKHRLQLIGNKLEKTHGKYPHGAMHFPATDSPSNKRLHPKATCPKCNYSVVLSLKSIQIGPPICPKDNILMVKQGRW